MKFSILLDDEIESSSGLYPVKIRLEHQGCARLYETGIECRKEYWDAEKECVMDKDSLHILKNSELEASQRRIAGEIQSFLDKCLSTYMKTAECRNYGTQDRITFLNLIESKIKSTDALNTKRGYECFRRYFESIYGEGPCLMTISNDFAYRFFERLNLDYKDSSAKFVMGNRFMTVWNHGVSIGAIQEKFCPRKRRVLNYKCDRNLSLDAMRHLYLKYRETIQQDPQITNIRTLAIALFFLDMSFQGLAPVDLSNLRVGDLKFSTTHTLDDRCLRIVKISTYRKKTLQPVKIVAWIEPIAEVIESLTNGKSLDDYLIPCFCLNKHYTDDERQNRLCNYFNKMATILNELIMDDVGLMGLIGDRKVTYYFARHGFCNLVNRLDVPIHVIQTMIGHKSTVLEKNYLAPPDDSMQLEVSKGIYRILTSS